MLTLDGPGAPGVEGLVLAFGQVGQAFGHGVFHAGEANAHRVGPEIGTVTGARYTPGRRPTEKGSDQGILSPLSSGGGSTGVPTGVVDDPLGRSPPQSPAGMSGPRPRPVAESPPPLPRLCMRLFTVPGTIDGGDLRVLRRRRRQRGGGGRSGAPAAP